jgi:L-2-hydroxycarboxylate dehydrogenase (NAD+)
VKVTGEIALRVAKSVLEDKGAPPAHAMLQADVLVEAEMKGHPSHGLQRLPRLLNRIERGIADPCVDGDWSWRSPSFLEGNGQRGLGPVVARRACDLIAERVHSTGVAIAGIKNSNHVGMLAYYVEYLASKGMIGIAMSSSEALVHPYGGTRALLGTNPLAIAIPTSERPMVVDLATSLVSMGKIHHHAATGTAIPQAWARDKAGMPTTDAAAAMEGSIAPFGDAKGYALGMAIELLVASIAGSALAPDIRGTLDDEAVCNKGDVLIAIGLGEQPQLLTCFTHYLDQVRHSQPAESSRPVFVPGDGATSRRNSALADGFEIAPRLWRELNELSHSKKPLVKGHG